MREVKDMENFLIQAAYDEKAVETASVREITASGVSLVIPAEYLGMERMEGDPEDAEIYGFNSEESDGVAFFSLIPREDALPFGDVDSVIENVHEILEESQGLIRVGSGSIRPPLYLHDHQERDGRGRSAVHPYASDRAGRPGSQCAGVL